MLVQDLNWMDVEEYLKHDGRIILVTPDQVQRQRSIVGTIIRPALQEGKVLYVRNR